ncbi:MAG: hypothetical protein KU38_08425 [Sulfurovum sp. FS08-3]|nr:MAG: hypothetical protein KU38_08425 [Sulfurovum sp. FS08-3]
MIGFAKFIASWLYNQIWLFGVVWTMMVILLTVLQNYPDCTANVEWLHNLLYLLTAFFIINTAIIFLFLFSQTRKIKRNINSKKKPLDNLCISYYKEENDPQDNKRVFILPVYVMFLYALSRVIMMLMHEHTSDVEHYISFIIWGFILYFSIRFWYYLRQYVDIEDRYSINYTLVVLSWTILAVFWEHLIPYIADIIKLTQCLIDNISKLSHACSIG